MTINRDKCKLNCEKISYLGYQISREGISPDERLTNKIAKMEKPMNKKELESFLALISIADIESLLNHLLKRVKKCRIYMDAEENKAFKALKKALTSKSVIKIFIPKKRLP